MRELLVIVSICAWTSASSACQCRAGFEKIPQISDTDCYGAIPSQWGHTEGRYWCPVFGGNLTCPTSKAEIGYIADFGKKRYGKYMNTWLAYLKDKNTNTFRCPLNNQLAPPEIFLSKPHDKTDHCARIPLANPTGATEYPCEGDHVEAVICKYSCLNGY